MLYNMVTLEPDQNQPFTQYTGTLQYASPKPPLHPYGLNIILMTPWPGGDLHLASMRIPNQS